MRLDRLVSLAGLAAMRGADGERLFAQATLRGWIERDLRGFRTRCVVKAGGRTLVDLDALDGWLEDGRGGKRDRNSATAADAPTPRRQRRDYDDVLRRAGLG